MQDNNFYKDDPIIVLGRPHSGTSMTVKILEMLGMSIKEDKDKKSFSYTHRENRGIDLLEFILVRRGLIELGLDRKDVVRTIRKRVNELYSGIRGFWGFKILSGCKNLDVWIEAFPRLKIVYIYRKSISRHHITDAEHWKFLQDDYHDRLYNHLKKYPETKILEIVYDEVLEKPEEHFEKIANFLGVELSEKLRNYASEFTKLRD